MRLSADFSAGQKTVNIFKVLKRKKMPTKNNISGKIILQK